MQVSKRFLSLDVETFARRFEVEIVPYLSPEEVHLRLGRQQVLSQLQRMSDKDGDEISFGAELQRLGAR